MSEHGDPLEPLAPLDHDGTRSERVSQNARAKRYAIGAGAAGAIMGTLALLGAFQPSATAQTSDSSNSGSSTSESDASVPSDVGGRFGRHHMGDRLTDEQRECLQDQGVTRPKRRSGPPSQAQIDKLKAAAEACGIELPDFPRGGCDDDAASSDTNSSDGTGAERSSIAS